MLPEQALSAASFGPAARGSNAQPLSLHIERELKFLVAFAAVSEFVRFERCRCKVMEQRYFAKSAFPELRGWVRTCLGISLPRGLDFSSARIRTVFTAGAARQYLEFKTSKQGRRGLQVPVERKEAQISIRDAELAKALEAMALAGFVKKTRYSVPGWVENSNGRRIDVVAQIDRLMAAGAPDRGGPWQATADFCLVDVEFNKKRDHLKCFKRGTHSFPFLKAGCAVDLSEERREVRKLFSSRRLARLGVDAAVTEAAAKLL
jgi:hypothetical protein